MTVLIIRPLHPSIPKLIIEIQELQTHGCAVIGVVGSTRLSYFHLNFQFVVRVSRVSLSYHLRGVDLLIKLLNRLLQCLIQSLGVSVAYITDSRINSNKHVRVPRDSTLDMKFLPFFFTLICISTIHRMASTKKVKQMIQATSVNATFFGKDPECALHCTTDTEDHFRHHSPLLTSDQARISYFNSYHASEKNRGPLNHSPISNFSTLGDPHLIKRFAEYAAFSYCLNTTAIQKMSKMNMRVGSFQIVGSGLDSFGNVSFFMAQNLEQNLQVLVLRGTTTKTDMRDDFDVFPVPVNPAFLDLRANVTGKVHRGFWRHYIRNRDNVTALVGQNYDSLLDFVIVGHSLGSAWAELTAADLTSQNYTIKAVYSFGGPKLGDKDMVAALVNLTGPDRIVRTVNGNDMIPHFGFVPNGYHSPLVTEYFIPPGKENIITCQGGQDPTCSDSIPCLQYTWAVHGQLGSWSIRRDLCGIQTPMDDSVYT